MTEKHYLLKVLGLSGIPKLITFGLTLLSFPLLIRALGAAEYGVVLLISAALGIFEVLVDFGVSSAAGKAMASVRVHHPRAMRSEFFAWVRLQAFFVVIGFAPMMLAAFFMMQGNTTPKFKLELLYVLGAATVSQVALNFIRANLLSLLAFKSLAVLDTFESVLRSAGFLVVAFLFPTAVGLALVSLIVSVVTATLAVMLIGRRLSSGDSCLVAPSPNIHAALAPVSVESRLRDSFNFLWLRLSTRLFQQGPLLLIGRLLGTELVGIIGAFSKINEIISTPYLVIGNALMVRVNEISGKGQNALQALWDTAFRIMSTALLFAALVFLAAEPLAHGLLPASQQAPEFFAILAMMVIASAASGLISPMSDYAGGLLQRNMLLSIFSFLQLLILWRLTICSTQTNIIIAIVAIYSCMILSYTFIAAKAIFGHYKYHVDMNIFIFSCIVFSMLILTVCLKNLHPIDVFIVRNSLLMLLSTIVFFLLAVVVGVFLIKGTRNYYFTREFFHYSNQ